MTMMDAKEEETTILQFTFRRFGWFPFTEDFQRLPPDAPRG